MGVLSSSVFPSAIACVAPCSSSAINRRFAYVFHLCSQSPHVVFQNGLEDAPQAFQQRYEQTAVSWTTSICGFSRAGQSRQALKVYDQMLEEGVVPDRHVFVGLLKACSKISDLKEGKRIHAEAVLHGYGNDTVVSTCVVDMYAKCGRIGDARQVFDKMLYRDVISWNAMLAGYALHSQAEMVLQLYRQMRQEGVNPDHWTFVSVLQACGSLAEKEKVEGGLLVIAGHLQMGKALNAESWSRGYGSDVFVGSILISMYDKCGSIADAEHVFEGLLWRDRVSWNAMLAAYAHQDQGEKALHTYGLMQQECMVPNARTVVSVIHAISLLAQAQEDAAVDPEVLHMGKVMHAEARRQGYDADVFVANALVSMYGKCGSISDAQNAFDELSHRDLVSWNALLTGYAQQEDGAKALQLYEQMIHEGVNVDETTYVCIFQACAHAGALDTCIQIHKSLVGTKSSLSLFVASSLIDAYAKCARMQDAQKVFDVLCQPDAASWNALIAGYARQGDCEQSLLCYAKMQLTCTRPSPLTFLSLISACSHAGLVDEGIKYFESMSDPHGLAPGIEHYVSIVDLLARRGYFSMVEGLLLTMPMKPSRSLWFCLLSACRKHENVVLGKRAFDAIVRMQPKDAAPYILMWNIYSNAGMWDCANHIDELRENAGAWKKPGQSWIDHKQEVHTFMAGKEKHMRKQQIYILLRKLCAELEHQNRLSNLEDDYDNLAR